MLQEREAWMERRAEFLALYVLTTPPPDWLTVGAAFAVGLRVVMPTAALSLLELFDLVVVPISVQREHKRWLEDTLLTRLKPGGRLIIVNDP